jgi:hypothetical protein
VQAIFDDRAVLPTDQFRAERLSMWLPKAAESLVFDPAQWEALCDPKSKPVTDLALGVDADPNREAATVCLAGRRGDGRLHVEWYTSGPGVAWLPKWVDERLNAAKVRAVVVDERGTLADLDWAAEKLRPTLVGHRDVANAAGLLWNAVTDGTVAHRGQVELSKAVLCAKQRPMLGGQAFGWDRKAPGSSVLLAVSLALWGVDCERPARPRRGSSQRRLVVLS